MNLWNVTSVFAPVGPDTQTWLIKDTSQNKNGSVREQIYSYAFKQTQIRRSNLFMVSAVIENNQTGPDIINAAAETDFGRKSILR